MELTAERFKSITPSLTLSITSEAKKMKAEGKDICNFGAGEPDFDTPEHIKEAAAVALGEGKTKYIASSGLPELRSAIAEKLLVENNLEYTPNQITINCGAKHSCFNAISVVCDPGDEVIIPSPYWLSYPEMVRIVGAEPVFVETKAENDWKITAEEFENAMSPKTKMIILNSPNNPTGAVYSKEELEKIADVAISEDIVVLSDEIYEKLVYEDKHISIASLNKEIFDLTITIGGFSKAYAMTGWRLGYTATANQSIAKALDTLQSHSTSNATTFAQYGAISAIEGEQQIVNDMKDEFDMRRQYVMGRLDRIKNIKYTVPKGAFYFLIDISKMGLGSINLAERLLTRYHVATVPGIAFGNDNTIRISYATGIDTIKKGMDRLTDFCKSH